MKAIKISLIVILALAAVLFLLALIFINTFDINRYKPQIVKRASQALNRQVDFEKANLTISLKQGISLKITGLSISEDPAFGGGDFLTVRYASFGIDVLGLVFHRKVNVPSVFIDSPRITIIRGGDGSVNLNKLGRLKEKDRQISAPTLAALPALLINSVKVTGGTLTYIDNLFTPALKLEIKKLGLEANRVSLTDAFPLKAEAAFFSDEQNVFLQGKLQLDAARGELMVSDLKGNADLSRILLEQLPISLPMLKNVPLPSSLKGELVLSLSRMLLNAEGLSALSAELSLRNASLKLKEMASPLEDVALKANVTEKDIVLENASAKLGQGKIEAKGAIQDYFLKQNYQLQASAQDLGLADLIAQDESPVKTEGRASGHVTLSGEGFSPSNINSNLLGTAGITVLKPVLKDLNVLRVVLDKISVIPGLAEKIETNLPERFKQKLTRKDTAFSDIKLAAAISNGRVLVQDLLVEAEEFKFKGKAEAGFDALFSLEGAFYIVPELSQAMTAAADQLKYLLDAEGQIYLPLKVSGSASELKFNVDAAYMTKKLLTAQGTQELFKIIDKALGREDEGATPQEQNTQAQPDSQKQAPGTEEKVKDLLEQIFR